MSDDRSPGYPEPPTDGDEGSTLLGSLERQRATFVWKCADLTREQMAVTVGASQLTIARLLKHLAFMEDLNFHGDLGGHALPEPWSGRDPGSRSAWVFASADHDSPETLHRLWRDAVARSHAAVQEHLARGGPGATYVTGNGHRVTLRRLLVDMIEEYGRHTGHADLIREAVDGRTGEDPPGPARAFVLGGPVFERR